MQESVVQSLPSGGHDRVIPPEHSPLVQMVSMVHGSPSEQSIPFGASTCWQPRPSSHSATVHGLPSPSQRTGWPPEQVPPMQIPFDVHSFVLWQGVPSGAATWLHPLAGSHSASAQGSFGAGQLVSSELHFPALHVPSGPQTPPPQPEPSGNTVVIHPNTGSHARCSHGRAGPQSTLNESVHSPVSHESPMVQGSPSLHSVPLGCGICRQFPVSGWHEPCVHGPSSGQIAVSPVQTPEVQTVFDVHKLLSSQGKPSGTGNC